MKLDFLGIGVNRGGTTWINKCLEEHPEICMSTKKELKFFDKDVSEDWLDKFFTGKGLKGDISPATLENIKKLLPKIKKHNKDIKIFISLRNPANRAWSHFIKHKIVNQRGIKSNTNIIELIKKDKKAYKIYIKKGFYYNNLKYLLDNFDNNNILIFRLEDFQLNPQEYIKRLYKFLGVNESFVPKSINKEINRSGQKVARFESINLISQKIYSYNRYTRYFLNKIYRKIIKEWNLKKVNNYKKEKISKYDYDCLCGIFKEDIKKTNKLLNNF